MSHNFLVTCLVLVACGDDTDTDTSADTDLSTSSASSASATMTGGSTLSTTVDPSTESSETVDPSDTDPSSETVDPSDTDPSSDTTAAADSSGSSTGNPVGPDCTLGDGPTFAVTASSSADYTIDGETDPALTVVRGCTYTFDVDAQTHPFRINTVQGVGAANSYDVGVTGNGTQMGQVTWEVALDAPDSLFYNCETHSGMTNTITVISDE